MIAIIRDGEIQKPAFQIESRLFDHKDWLIASLKSRN